MDQIDKTKNLIWTSQLHKDSDDLINKQKQYDQTTLITQQLKKFLHDFRKESLQWIIESPRTSLFDFITSQHFNDLWDVLNACENQLQMLSVRQIQKFNRNFNKTDSFEIRTSVENDLLRVRSYSLKTLNNENPNISIQGMELEDIIKKLKRERQMKDIEFSLTQQLIYDMTQSHNTQFIYNKANETRELKESLKNKDISIDESPKQQKNKNSQRDVSYLFSFDSSCTKNLPLQRKGVTTIFDTNFNISLSENQLQSTLANISGIVREEEESGFSCIMEQPQMTSRFEQQQCSDIFRSEIKKNWNINAPLQMGSRKQVLQKNEGRDFKNFRKELDEREKQLASKELKLILKEKQLITTYEEIRKFQNEIQIQREILDEDKESFDQYKQKELFRFQEMKKQYYGKQFKLINKENNDIYQIGMVKGNIKSLIQRMKNNQ